MLSRSEDERDDVVVPWISLLGSRSCGGCPSAATSGSDVAALNPHPSHHHDDSFTTTTTQTAAHRQTSQRPRHTPISFQQQQSGQSSCKILSLLSTRERIGMRSSPIVSIAAANGGGAATTTRVGWLYEGRNVTTTSLVKFGAW